MSDRRPPADFASSKLDLVTLPPGEVWLRIYWSKHTNPLGFGYQSSRFSDPRMHLPESDRYGVVYLGSTHKVCFVEAILRDQRNGHLEDFPIPFSEIRDRTCAEIAIRAPLTLVDLRGDGPLRPGVPTDAVRASDHGLGQLWSQTFWSHPQAPDGILYPSRLNEQRNLALFDRAIPKARR